MGTLRDFELGQFDCNIYVETGTGEGYSLLYALAQKFDRVYSVECDRDTYAFGTDMFGVFRNLTLIHSDSPAALDKLLPTLSPQDRVLFFLDAHFPGELSPAFKGFQAERDRHRRLPLEKEIEVIARHRPGCRDVIIVDDLRIYENGPFESGPMPAAAETLSPADKNIDFVARLLPGRNVKRDYRREGYLVITPP